MFRKLSGFFLIFIMVPSFVSSASAADGDHLVVYAADSLSGAMEAFIPLYNRFTNHNDDFVLLCCTGSSELVNDITLNNGTPDLLLSADYKLIDDRLISKYTKWNAEFARNSVVIAYRENSTNVSDINGDNWYKVLNDSNVIFGIADPNMDPCGYRSFMTIDLANNYAGYSNPNIFNDLITANSDIYATKNGTGYDIFSPTYNEAKPKIIVDAHAADSLDSLINGSVDYAFVYKNQAEEAKYNDPNIDYVTLPNELSLNDTQYTEKYSHIRLFQNYTIENGSAVGVVTLTPIVYGLTQLSVGKSPDAAQSFLEMFCTYTRDENPQDPSAILRYMDHIVPLVASNRTNWNDIPIWMQHFMTTSNVTISPDGDKSIQDAVDEVPAKGVIYLNPGMYSKLGDYDVNVTAKDITFIAVNNSATVDALGKGRIFNIDANSEVRIESLTFEHGKITDNGGAVSNAGDLTIVNSGFNNNSANSGGSIYNTNKLNISHTTLNNNTVSFRGGAIYNDHGDLNIESDTLNSNSILNGNNADNGGAISNNEGNLIVTDSSFENNGAVPGSGYYGQHGCGGAVDNLKGSLIVSNSKFNGNHGRYGGAINSYYGYLKLINCQITNNKADSIGGGVCSNSGVQDIDDKTKGMFNGNSPNDMFHFYS
ncbi:MAG: substrate-binding domain-containing protein [Methanobrevibacter sp.]|jgi:tungstate ABC transporter binding protein WtpA|nr:substrate-binding domain-containing protein [Candidatus Methanovirga procula]